MNWETQTYLIATAMRHAGTQAIEGSISTCALWLPA